MAMAHAHQRQNHTAISNLISSLHSNDFTRLKRNSTHGTFPDKDWLAPYLISVLAFTGSINLRICS
jgi:hypothetical protein